MTCGSSRVRFLVSFHVKAGGLSVAKELGITDYRAIHVVARFELLCGVSLSELLCEAEVAVVARLAESSGKSGAEVTAVKGSTSFESL
jgi:hypothetical protein